jgi:hypothetical protein
MAHGDAQKMQYVLIVSPSKEFANQLLVGPNFAGMVDQHF